VNVLSVPSFFDSDLSALAALAHDGRWIAGRCFYQHLALLAATRMVGVGEFEQFDGRAVFDYERDADAVGWAVGRNQDFAASQLRGEISHFKRAELAGRDQGPPRPLRNASTPRQIRFSRG
jgi:hypothetical protein